MPGTTRPTAFESAGHFQRWLERNHAEAPELVVRCFKVHAAHRGITYKAALDEALCFGWIDGVRHAHDEDSFTVRFTRRKALSVWSAVNIKRMGELVAEGRVRPPGEAAFRARREDRSRIYSFENEPRHLDPARVRRFRANRRAWAFYASQAPWYRRTSAFWVMSAKKEETRDRRLATLIECSAAEIPIHELDRSDRAKRAQRPRRAT